MKAIPRNPSEGRGNNIPYMSASSLKITPIRAIPTTLLHIFVVYLSYLILSDDRVEGTDCGDEAADWLQRVLDRPGLRLVRQSNSDGRRSKRRQTGITAYLVS